MTCRDVLQFLMEYLNGELPPEQSAGFEAHLLGCPSCVNYLNSYRQTVALGQMLSVVEAEAEVPEELLRAVLASTPDLA